MAIRAILTFDAGTHGFKAGAIDPANGARLGAFVKKTLTVRECGVRGRIKDQDPAQLRAAMIETGAAKANELGRLGYGRDEIAIGTSGHMHADFLVGEKTIEPGSMWNCQRNAAQFNFIMNTPGLRRMFIDATANEPMMRGIFLKKLHRATATPRVWDATKVVLTTNNLLTYFLTGQTVLETSDGISALDPRTNTYAEQLFAFFGLENKLPKRVVKSTDVVGTLLPEMAAALGLAQSTMVAGGGGDQMTALLGNGVRPGVVGLNYGGSGVTLARSNNSDPTGRIHFFGDWLMACCMATGLSIDALAEKTGKSVPDLMAAALKSRAGANGVRFYPWANGINHPVKAANTTARFVNGRKATLEDRVRAVLEGTNLEMVLCVRLMEQFGNVFNSARMSGGGSKDETGLTQQVFADMLGFRLVQNAEAEASSLGAAVAAAVAAGLYPNVEAAMSAMVHDGKVFDPNAGNRQLYIDMGGQYYTQVAKDYPAAWARHTAAGQVVAADGVAYRTFPTNPASGTR